MERGAMRTGPIIKDIEEKQEQRLNTETLGLLVLSGARDRGLDGI